MGPAVDLELIVSHESLCSFGKYNSCLVFLKASKQGEGNPLTSEGFTHTVCIWAGSVDLCGGLMNTFEVFIAENNVQLVITNLLLPGMCSFWWNFKWTHKILEFRRHRILSLNRQLQCKSVKIYRGQTPQYLALRQILVKRAHTGSNCVPNYTVLCWGLNIIGWWI